MPPPLQAHRMLLSHRRISPAPRRRFTAASSLSSAPAKTVVAPAGPAPSSILSIRESLLSGERTAADITSEYLSRLRRTEPTVRSFIHVADAAAEREAEELDRRIASGGKDAVGPLAGVLVGVKDNLCTADMPSTGGSRILDGFQPAYDATAVRRLREAGAIVVGKTNLDEFGMGSTTEGSAYQVTTNPWDDSRVPGGSSGGSASAVSSRQCVVSLGSDTGGSVRQPASFCGVVGLKPTYGRVSRFGLMAYASSLDVVGCFGSSVFDTATMLSVIAGHDKMDSTSSSHDVPDYRSDLASLDLLESKPLNNVRIGIIQETLGEGVDTGVISSIKAASSHLEQLGSVVEEVSLPSFSLGLPAYYILASSEASSNLSRYDGIRYGKQASADELNELYGDSRASGLGHEETYSAQLSSQDFMRHVKHLTVTPRPEDYTQVLSNNGYPPQMHNHEIKTWNNWHITYSTTQSIYNLTLIRENIWQNTIRGHGPNNTSNGSRYSCSKQQEPKYGLRSLQINKLAPACSYPPQAATWKTQTTSRCHRRTHTSISDKPLLRIRKRFNKATVSTGGTGKNTRATSSHEALVRLL
ncbi:unnamed protein product [Alopecurus aequalis]